MIKSNNYSFFQYPEAFVGFDELSKRVIRRWAGDSDYRLVYEGNGRFSFEDVNNPHNIYLNKFIGLVDPMTTDIDIYSTRTIFCVDDEENMGKLFIIATDGMNSLDTKLFIRVADYYGL